ncbi:Z1 domain-containing protein [Pontiellaceae bacterium B1224]|nr:Z1 domain-containing protein [Pontiellaceae bacterium B1224]
MMADIQKLTDAVSLVLENHEPPTEEALYQLVKAQATVIQLSENYVFSDDEMSAVVRTLQARFVHRMSMGALFEAEDYRPWLPSRQGDIDWYYWKRYEKHLRTTKGFPPKVVRTLDQITDKVLDRLEDPSKEGEWGRRGLVVGHVQSGKTANYTGLICKAADAGYKVIIVLAGLLNSLRNQTQERIDSDFMGWCTRMNEYVGASRFGSERRPVCFTTSIEDFKKATANSIAMNLDALNEPIVFVLKKNKSTLENLHRWLLEHNKHNLREYSMLLIDDEADHASINTNKEDKDPTTINRAIRDILSIFSRSSFVGYTATPFANIFVDPETEDEMKNGELYKDLFPRDFILSLDPPDNYVGPHRIFTDGADLDSVRPIDDNEDVLPLKHKIDFEPEALPGTLEIAIDCFILAKAIRLLRGQDSVHHSMMVNASRFTRVQNELKGIIAERIKETRYAIGNYASLEFEQALENSVIERLYKTWQQEYASGEYEWHDVQGMLKESVDPIEVISVNSGSQDVLDYSDPDGRSVIAVGGIGLSRGLTLEGLLVSYFLRNSIMYDTLMQMGRWFGYRPGYEDLCRIFMTEDAESWYSHIAGATEELREDFHSMEKLKLTPIQFGLRVRSHPASLIVTARNKMRKGTTVPHSVSLTGRLIETIALPTGKDATSNNINLVHEIISRLQNDEHSVYRRTQLGHEWDNVQLDCLASFIEQFTNHPQSFYTFYSKALVEYIDLLKAEGKQGVVLLKTLIPKEDDDLLPVGCNLTGRIQNRASTAVINDEVISFKKKARVGEPKDEAAGLTENQLEELKQRTAGKTINPREYRNVDGKKPLLIIHLLQLPSPHETVVAYGISFPGCATTRRMEKLVEYVVNIPWWKNHYGDSEDEESEEL